MTPNQEPPDGGGILDVSQLSFAQMLESDDSVLAACVKRLIAAADDPDGIISAFQNYAS